MSSRFTEQETETYYDGQDEISAALRTRAHKFRTHCEKKFDWTFYQDGEVSEDDEDDAPVIVSLD